MVTGPCLRRWLGLAFTKGVIGSGRWWRREGCLNFILSPPFSMQGRTLKYCAGAVWSEGCSVCGLEVWT